MKTICDNCNGTTKKVGRLYKISQGKGSRKLWYCKTCRRLKEEEDENHRADLRVP